MCPRRPVVACAGAFVVCVQMAWTLQFYVYKDFDTGLWGGAGGGLRPDATRAVEGRAVCGRFQVRAVRVSRAWEGEKRLARARGGRQRALWRGVPCAAVSRSEQRGCRGHGKAKKGWRARAGGGNARCGGACRVRPFPGQSSAGVAGMGRRKKVGARVGGGGAFEPPKEGPVERNGGPGRGRNLRRRSRAPGRHAQGNTERQDGPRTEVWGQQKQSNDPRHIQHSPNTPTTGLRERGNDTGRSTGRSGRQKAATRRNMRREERVTVQGPVKEHQPDGMSHGGSGKGAHTSGPFLAVLERPYTVGGGGGKPPPGPPSPPPPPSPLPMFEADSQNCASAPSVPRGFTLKSPWGPWGRPWEEGGPSQTPLPPPPLLIHPSGGGV